MVRQYPRGMNLIEAIAESMDERRTAPSSPVVAAGLERTG